MNRACEMETCVQNELSLRFTIVSHPTPVLDYIKTISSLVGASHLLAVFEENNALKIFFDDKRSIDFLLRSKIHIMGHHVSVDYVVPPGAKVILSNIDPIVSNFELTKFLSKFGTIVSPVVCPPISDEVEYCHISYGIRYCYMKIYEHIPDPLEFKYGDQLCIIKVKVIGDVTLMPPFIKSDECDLNCTDHAVNNAPEPSSDIDIIERASPSPIPIVVSVESAAEFNANVHLGVAKLPVERNYVSTHKGRSTLKIKRTKVTATSRAAKKIKNTVKQKWIGRKKNKTFKKGKKAKSLLKQSSPPLRLPSLSPTSSDIDDRLSDDLPPLLITENKDSEGPLNEEKLLEFIDGCKHNRAPIELAKKYLGSDCDDNAIHKLADQIERHLKNTSCPSLKHRLPRLCKVLKESTNTQF